jgi:drug/metabolite transporter (DMT)-like permease
MTQAIRDAKSLKRRSRWGWALILTGMFLMSSPDDLIVISGLPVAIVGIVVVWPAITSKRTEDSMTVTQHTAKKKKAGSQIIIAAVVMTVLFLLSSPRVPREQFTVYLICVLGVACMAMVTGFMMWRPWKSRAQSDEPNGASPRRLS